MKMATKDIKQGRLRQIVRSEQIESQNLYIKEYIYDYCRMTDRPTDQVNHIVYAYW